MRAPRVEKRSDGFGNTWKRSGFLSLKVWEPCIKCRKPSKCVVYRCIITDDEAVSRVLSIDVIHVFKFFLFLPSFFFIFNVKNFEKHL